MQEFLLKVPDDQSGMRVDQFIAFFSKGKELGFSRTRIQKAICKGSIKFKNGSLIKPHYKIKSGDEFIVRVEDEKRVLPAAEDISLDVVYEDEDLAIINKPSGLVVHPGAGNPKHTLVNALLHRFKKISDINPLRPGIVHRIDKETSGLLVIAKNNHSHLELSRQFAKHTIKRKYIALVKGRLEFDENVIELPIGRHPVKRESMSVSFAPNNRYAKTYYKTLKRAKDFSLLELHPFTGRTHQLRVHLAFIGHPILGDDKYGKGNDFSRLGLHAIYLGFNHPRTGKFVEFSCGLPPEFNEAIKSK